MSERIITIRPAWDRRSSDPGKDYGIHGVEIRWVLKGDLGATQFLLYTNWLLPENEREREMRGAQAGMDYRITRPMPADLGYHSPHPMYKGQEERDCDVLGRCYYDGSGLNAERVYERLVREGGEAVWTELESYYDELFKIEVA